MTKTASQLARQLDPVQRARLKWRARRGLLENDLLLERFFSRYENGLSDAEARALLQLLELSDHALLELLLAHAQPTGDLATPEVSRLLGWLRAG